jgi:hypothetical protein
MGELKRKDEILTTADLAGRADKNKTLRDDPAIEDRAIDRENIDRKAIDRENIDRNANEEWGGPTLIQRETPGEARRERKLDKNPAAATPVNNSAPLFSEADVNDLRGRWSNAQSNFVDEPRKAVEEADQLVATVMQRLADGFASERSTLEKQWDKGDNVSTEDLRVALQRYRSFFDRLLAA